MADSPNTIPTSRLQNLFREAHAAARRRMAPQSYPGAGRQWDEARHAFVVIDLTYRHAFAAALRAAWAEAKAEAACAAAEAHRPVLTADELAAITELSIRADYQVFTTSGVRAARRLRSEASAIRAAADRRAVGQPLSVGA